MHLLLWMNFLLDSIYIGFVELRRSSWNRNCNLSHRKLTISLDHLVTFSDDELWGTGRERENENEIQCLQPDSNH